MLRFPSSGRWERLRQAPRHDSPDSGWYRDDEPLLRRRARAAVKILARSVVRAPRDRRRVVMIFGCQRSGTTMLQQTFLDRSWRVLILEEHDRRLVGDDPEANDWEDDHLVFRRVRHFPFEVVATKPLVESYRAVQLMSAGGDARSIWMLRHYRGVARSNVKRFGAGNPLRDLQPFATGDSLDWRFKGATEQTRGQVIELLPVGLTPLDAAALFWWTRNQLYFDQRLWEDERIRILRYERACNHSNEVVRSLSGHLGITLPPGPIARRVRREHDAGMTIDLHPKIEHLCQTMWKSFVGLPEL